MAVKEASAGPVLASPSSVCRTPEICKTKPLSNAQSLNLGSIYLSFSFAPCTSREGNSGQRCQGLQWRFPKISPPCWRRWNCIWPSMQMVLLPAEWISEILKRLSYPHHLLGLSHFHSLPTSYLFCQGSICCLNVPSVTLHHRSSIPHSSPERSKLPSLLPTLQLPCPFLRELLSPLSFLPPSSVNSHLFQMPLLQSFTPEDYFSSVSLCHLSCAKTSETTPLGKLLLSKALSFDFLAWSILGVSSIIIKKKKKGYKSAANRHYFVDSPFHQHLYCHALVSYHSLPLS